MRTGGTTHKRAWCACAGRSRSGGAQGHGIIIKRSEHAHGDVLVSGMQPMPGHIILPMPRNNIATCGCFSAQYYKLVDITK